MKNKIIYIEWIESIYRSGYFEDGNNYIETLVKSVGYIVSENKDTISITTSINGISERQPKTVVIEKCTIKETRNLKI